MLNTYGYLPFGESLGAVEAVPNPFEYVGRFGVMREGSGLDFMRARWYSPSQGRFTQMDPMGLLGGFNFYGYARDNPLTIVDPSGTIPDPLGLATSFVIKQALTHVLPPASHPPASSADRTAAGLESIAEKLVVKNGAKQIAVNTVATAEEQLIVQAASRAVLSVIGQGIGYAALGIGILSLAQSLHAFQTFVRTGNDVGCIPGVPAGAQVCNPNVDFLTGKLKQTLTVEQVDPAEDPNEIIGPSGFGAERHLRPIAPLPYVIFFQNKPEALGPAAEVVITHDLDPDLDLDTFELDQFGFGELLVPVPAGRQFFSTRLDLTATRGVFVDVVAQLDRATRRATWTFRSIDPETLDLTSDPSVGFLPPDRTAPEGQGSVSFFVRAKRACPANRFRSDAFNTMWRPA